jgi:hypothetical protein
LRDTDSCIEWLRIDLALLSNVDFGIG